MNQAADLPLDETHDAARRSWVDSANGDTVFPLQNLPLGVFTPPGGDDQGPRGGIAIGDRILDLRAVAGLDLFDGDAGAAVLAAAGSTLNPLLALGSVPRRALRAAVFALLSEGTETGNAARRKAGGLLHPAADCTLHLPARIGDYTDFYAGIHHAYNGGLRHKRPSPLLPNYKWVPVAYHSRASSVVVSGTPLNRPNGQRKLPDEEAPTFGPCRKLDFELELGAWIGPGNARGEPIPITNAGEHVAGLCMLNDWSARDIQGWEMQPLGPFLAKNFTTTVSPWIVTTEALLPYRIAQPPRPEGDPQPLPYLWDGRDQATGAYDIAIEALILTPAMRAQGTAPHPLNASNLRHLYWTLAQMVAHHTCGGCNLQPGDLFGSGTISAPDRSGYGSLAELSDDGRTQIVLPSGETRTFLQDGDELILRASARREGFATLGFGDCSGIIRPAPGIA
jgi:fumarylacetoacetase